MLVSMNQQEFLVELKQHKIHADWHRLYYEALARRYHRIDYWVKSILGLLALVGAVIAGDPNHRFLGAIISGGCAFLIANVLPIFKWDNIVSGFKAEEEEWTRIFQGYEQILMFMAISDRDEILVQEFERIKERQRAAALNNRILPKDQKLLIKLEAQVRQFYAHELAK